MAQVNVLAKNTIAPHRRDRRGMNTLLTRLVTVGLPGVLVLSGLTGCDQVGSAGSSDSEQAASAESNTTNGPPSTLFGADHADTTTMTGQLLPYQWHYPWAQRLQHMEGKPAPTLKLTNWHGEKADINALTNDDKITVVDFWATWCKPCVAALPKNAELAEKYADDVQFLGVHDANRGHERMQEVADDKGVNYPIAVDDDGASTSAWNVSMWPTYFVIDRNGIIRGAGIRPNHIDDAIQALLEENQPAGPVSAANEPWVSADADQYTADTAPSAAPVPQSWLENNAKAQSLIDQDTGYGAPPMIQSERWLNAEDLSLNQLRGNVVLLRFWGTWCPHCLNTMDRFNALHERYADEGLVIIGITDDRNSNVMDALAEQHEVPYPMCADDGNYMKRAYNVQTIPDYFLIDRWGRLRVANCNDDSIEPAIKMLLEEKAP